ncbi:Cysteine synthase 2, partial [Coemansia sp. RSA 2703]
MPDTAVAHASVCVLAAAASLVACYQLYRWRQQQHAHENEHEQTDPRSARIARGVTALIGNTPLIRINSLSDATGCEVLGKAEFLNPGGSSKDRIALYLIERAEERGDLHPHTQSCIFEGTSGSTGISLAMVARAKGYGCHI